MSPLLFEERRDDGKNVAQRNERYIDGDDRERAGIFWKLLRGKRARVDPFDRDHARIGAQLPVQLSVAHVDGHDPRGAALQERVGKPPGRGADVEAEASGDVDAEGVERRRELDSAARDVGMLAAGEHDVGVRPDERAGLAHHLAVHTDLTGQDHGARAFARRGQAPLDKQEVKPDALVQWVRASTHRAIAGSWPATRADSRDAIARSTDSAASRRDCSSPYSAG